MASEARPPADRSLDACRIRMVLARSPHSKPMPGEVLDRLAELGRIERHHEGDLIHAAWRPVRRLWLVLGGGLRVTELDPHGQVLTLATLGEGSYFASASLVEDGTPEKWEAHAVGTTDLAVFELALLEREFGGDKDVEQHRRVLLYLRFWALTDLYRDALSVALPQRLARRLLGQALAAGQGRDVELRLSQADLASMLGASRSRVNGELRRLQADGVVRLGYRRIVVRDLALLRAAAGADVVPL
jgi:CRP-like cAMP-binding protein